MSFFEQDGAVVSQKTCPLCQTIFEITQSDRDFLQAVSPIINGQTFEISDPENCPSCRRFLKMLHFNQVNLFKRNCSATGKSIISNYPPDSPFAVYEQKYWYSDENDTLKYGRPFDFNRPFFEQFAELAKEVPRPALFTDYLKDENSAYTNCAGKNKNCYLIFDSDENWDCLYSYGINSCRSSLDLYRCQEMELCSDCLDSKGCYNCLYTENSEKCSDSAFLSNCIGCQNCIMCVNLHHKQNYFRNQPVSPEELAKIRAQLGNRQKISQFKQEFQQFKLQFPHKYIQGIQNENCTGNYLMNCKNARACFDSMNIWDGKYLTQVFIKAKDCMDCHEIGEAELCYESLVCGYNAYNLRFAISCLNQISNLTYCRFCFFSSDLFGCIGLKRQKYCILNKQYSQEEYEQLVPRIIEHMKKSGEFGNFFPPQLSDFPYNLSIAYENYPLTKQQALTLGFPWRDEEEKNYLPQTSILPDEISIAPESVTEEILACQFCRKNYKIIAQELSLCKQIGAPLPDNCFLCRNRARAAQRNPKLLYDRTCRKCANPIRTTFSPDRPEKVYCEKCFQESLN